MYTADKSLEAPEFANFRSELIRRFFNPQSYFFLCVSTQLENASSIELDLTEDDYLLVGQVMDRLVRCDDLQEMLAKLATLPRFQDFEEHLEEGVVELRDSGQSPEDVKHAIESMAHVLVDSLIDILHSPEPRAQLAHLISDPASGTMHSDTIDINEAVVDQLFSAADSAPVPEDEAIDSPASTPPIPLEEMRSPAPAPPGPNAPPSREVGSGPYRSSGHSTAATPDLEVGGERATDVLSRTIEIYESPEPPQLEEPTSPQLEANLAAVREAVAAVQGNPARSPRWGDVRQQLQSLRETAMVYGSEEIESLAFKGWRLLELRTHLGLSIDPAWARLYDRLASVLERLGNGALRGEALAEAGLLSSMFITVLQHPERAQELIGSSGLRKESRPAVAAPQAREDRSLKLPGEEDGELLRLIQEVRLDRHEQFETTSLAELEQLKPPEPATPATVAAPTAAPAAEGARGVVTRPAHATPRDPRLAAFLEEVGIYFEIVEEAIQHLLKDRSNRVALDSLELGTYSLKVAARKIDVEALARYPEHVEEYVQLLLAEGQAIELAALEAIRNGFAKLQQATCFDELQGPELRQLSNLILKYIKSLKRTPPSPPTAGDAPASRPASPSDGQSPLRDQHTGGTTNQGFSASAGSPLVSREAIDFLMVDDSDN